MFDKKENVLKLIEVWGLGERIGVEEVDKWLSSDSERLSDVVLLTIHQIKRHNEDKKDYKFDTIEDVRKYLEDKGMGDAVESPAFTMMKLQIDAGEDISDKVIMATIQTEVNVVKMMGKLDEYIGDIQEDAVIDLYFVGYEVK